MERVPPILLCGGLLRLISKLMLSLVSLSSIVYPFTGRGMVALIHRAIRIQVFSGLLRSCTFLNPLEFTMDSFRSFLDFNSSSMVPIVGLSSSPHLLLSRFLTCLELSHLERIIFRSFGESSRSSSNSCGSISLTRGVGYLPKEVFPLVELEWSDDLLK